MLCLTATLEQERLNEYVQEMKHKEKIQVRGKNESKKLFVTVL